MRVIAIAVYTKKMLILRIATELNSILSQSEGSGDIIMLDDIHSAVGRIVTENLSDDPIKILAPKR